MKRMTKEDVAALLRHLASIVESGDSMEGSFQYLIPSDGGNDLEVEASFRIGNLNGQGGMRLV